MSNRLAALSMLKANRDSGGDYFDMFVPLIAYAAKRCNTDELSTDELRSLVRDFLGIDIPSLALGTLVKRCAAQGFMHVERGIVIRDSTAIASLHIDEKMAGASRQCEHLVDSLVSYAHANFEVEISKVDAEAHLLMFIRQDHSVLLKRALGQSVIADDGGLASRRKIKTKYIIASFISHCLQGDPVLSASVATLAKGSILESVVYFPDLGRIQAKMSSFDCYLDTRVVIQALGLEGTAISDAVREFFTLLYECGASLKVFKDTSEEIIGVLNFAISVVKSNGLARPRSTAMTEYLLRSDFSEVTLTAMRDSLKVQLEGLKIESVPRPPHEVDLGIDWRLFEVTLTNAIRHYREEPLRHDINVLSAIHRLRRGRSHYHIEDSGAIFVTTNDFLARASMSLSRTETGTDNEIPYAVTAETLAAILWLKRPLSHPDLPAKQMLISCYSAMNPPSSVWSKYIIELDSSKSKGSITEEEYVYLRYSQPARNIFMGHLADSGKLELTISVEDVLRKLNSSLTKDLRRALAEKEASAVQLQNSLISANGDKEAIASFVERRNKRYSRNIARIVCNIVSPIVFVFITIFTLVSSPLASLSLFGLSGSSIASILLWIGSIFAVIDWYYGVSVRHFMRQFEVRLDAYLYRHINALFGVNALSIPRP